MNQIWTHTLAIIVLLINHIYKKKKKKKNMFAWVKKEKMQWNLQEVIFQKITETACSLRRLGVWHGQKPHNYTAVTKYPLLKLYDELLNVLNRRPFLWMFSMSRLPDFWKTNFCDVTAFFSFFWHKRTFTFSHNKEYQSLSVSKYMYDWFWRGGFYSEW